MRIRRSRRAEQSASGRLTTALLRAPLAKLDGDRGQALAGAYAAAISCGRVPFFLRDGTSVAAGRAARRRRLVKLASIASAACVALSMLFAPGLLADRKRLHAEIELRALTTPIVLAARTDSELQRTASALHEVAGFAQRNRSTLRLLGAISLALPESTAIASLRVDSAGGGALVLVSTSGPALVAPLSRLDAFASVQLAGTITREAIGAIEIPRLTVRFRHDRQKRPRI